MPHAGVKIWGGYNTKRIFVLDEGYVRLVETWGRGDARRPEAGIIEAARQSTQGSFRGWDTDEKLLKFLYTSRHATPFEFAGAVIEVQAPIFVFREWHRHRTQAYNEMSARYALLPNLNYIPSVARLMRQASGNKQAGAIAGAATLTVERAQTFRERLIRQYKEAEALYQESLEMGVPKELARVGLPVGRYSRMRASASLRNWLGFMTLRCDPAAQEEIRLYSWALFVFLKHAFPRTMALFAPSVLGNPEQHDLEYITGKKQLRLSVGAFGDTYHVRVGATRQERSNG